MFGALTEKLQQVFSSFARHKKLTEDNISEAVREVRMALLEADVNYGVTKTFVKKVKEKAIGESLIKTVSPGQQFIKIVHDELVDLMGKEESLLHMEGKPSVILLCGLQGSGKTTHCAKLAHFFGKKEYRKKALLAACDLQRPAAVEQLSVLGEKIGVPVFTMPEEKDPVRVASAALQRARDERFDLLIVDTAGRLHIDEELMGQLRAIKAAVEPHEILFVANATTGQDAVNSAAAFNEQMEVSGTILTMLDGNTRGGAAISIREVTQKPLKFEGIGEKLEDLQLFNPRSMADRILGMGDTINLVKKAQEHMDEEMSEKLEQKLRKASFTYEDYLQQMQAIKKMGPMSSLLKMIPGLGNIEEMTKNSDGEFSKVESMILSMTPKERQEKAELTPPRRRRIAKGSGRSVDDVNRLVKTFKNMKAMMKNMPNKKQMEKMMGGLSGWR